MKAKRADVCVGCRRPILLWPTGWRHTDGLAWCLDAWRVQVVGSAAAPANDRRLMRRGYPPLLPKPAVVRLPVAPQRRNARVGSCPCCGAPAAGAAS